MIAVLKMTILETDKSVSVSYSTRNPRLKSWAVKY